MVTSFLGLSTRLLNLSFQDNPQLGLLQTRSVLFEHGGTDFSGRYPEKIYMISPLAPYNFATFDWTTVSLITRLRLFHDSLAGVSALHHRGIMHRDISLRNILISSLSPPSAVLCDFGKATREASSNLYQLGPIPTLAPEIDGRRFYNSKIDVWSLALAWYHTFFPHKCNRAMGEGTYAQLMSDLDTLAEGEDVLGRQLIELMKAMLRRDPTKRISAADALRSKVMLSVHEIIASEDLSEDV